ncbi:MAG: hypothetical protein LC635_00045, partial [Pseudonocardiaceae bacterium]|nr:hypothetical protein [Pseudonocardiaceae bacterium]
MFNLPKEEIVMDPYGVFALAATRHDDLVREADESRIARKARESHEESRPAPRPASRPARVRQLRVARWPRCGTPAVVRNTRRPPPMC